MKEKIQFFLGYIPENKETIRKIISHFSLPRKGFIYKDNGHTYDSGENWEYKEIEYDCDSFYCDYNMVTYDTSPQKYDNEDELYDLIKFLFLGDKNYVKCKNSFGDDMLNRGDNSFLYTNNKRVIRKDGDFHFYEIEKEYFDFAWSIIDALALTLYHGGGYIPLNYDGIYFINEFEIDIKNKKISWKKFSKNNFDEVLKSQCKKIKESKYGDRFLNDLPGSRENGIFFKELILFVMNDFDLTVLTNKNRIEKEKIITEYYIGQYMVFDEFYIRKPFTENEILVDKYLDTYCSYNYSYLDKENLISLLKQNKILPSKLERLNFWSDEELKIIVDFIKQEEKKLIIDSVKNKNDPNYGWFVSYMCRNSIGLMSLEDFKEIQSYLTNYELSEIYKNTKQDDLKQYVYGLISNSYKKYKNI